MDLKKVQKQGRDETHKKTTLLLNNGGKERHTADIGSSTCLSFPPLFQSRIVFLHLFISALFLHFFLAPSLLERKVFRNFFPQFLFFLGKSLNPVLITSCFTSEYDITLQLNTLLLAASTSCDGGEHFWHWRQTRLALEMKHWKRVFKLQPRTDSLVPATSKHNLGGLFKLFVETLTSLWH